MFDAALSIAQPKDCIAKHLPPKVKGKTVVIGAGKASAAMAQAFEQAALNDGWSPDSFSGCVVTRYGYKVDCQYIKILEAAHPVPDEAGMNAAKEILATVENLTEDDQVIALISGGGSALLPLPVDEITLDEKQEINKSLLKSGANIQQMNIVRRHLSKIKGGRLAAACYPAKLTSLIISDVPGDDLQAIASGPTVADTSTCADALNIIDRFNINISDSVRACLKSGKYESMKPDATELSRTTTTLVATPQMALEAAAKVAGDAGVSTLILGDSIEGEAKDVGLVMAGITKQITQYHQPIRPPCILLSGGETTVTIKGNGIGGRNVEFLLSLAIALEQRPHITALAADTDGVDGGAEIAGAVINETTLARAQDLGITPLEYLINNDAHTFFQTLGDSLITGPTLTNVNDFRAIFISA
ncbi:glycerate kinase [Marinomonas agarivorans]|nr:glycerate kinase [Marinomonas agarivorans]